MIKSSRSMTKDDRPFQLYSLIKAGDKIQNSTGSSLFLGLERTYLLAKLMNFTENKKEYWQGQLGTSHPAPFLIKYKKVLMCMRNFCFIVNREDKTILMKVSL